MINVKNLTCGYQDKKILQDISFQVQEGEFVGIIGPNGAGKSTLLRALSRVIKPMEGNVFFEDIDIHKADAREIARKIAVVPQDSPIAFSFDVIEVVLMGRTPHIGRLQSESTQDLDISRRCMELTRSLELADRQIDQLSAGEKQRVIIARALAQQPKLLLLDEPTSHLDIGHKIQILNLIKKLNRQQNLTCLIVLHDLNLAAEYCQKLILLDEGKIHSTGTPGEILNYKTIEEVYDTVVVVKNNPISGKPYVFLVPDEK